MGIFQDPHTYVKQFIEEAIKDISGVKIYEEMRVPHLRIKCDYGVENVIIEAEPPCERERGKKQLISYMQKFGRKIGILIDIPIERYYHEYPSACRNKVGFEVYIDLHGKYDVIYKREFDPSKIGEAMKVFRELIELLTKTPLVTETGKLKPDYKELISRVNDLIISYKVELLKYLSKDKNRVRIYFNEWKNTMSIIYGEEIIDNIGGLEELFVKLTIYVTWLKILGTTLLEAALGGGKYTVPLQLYIEGSKAAIKLFWEKKALAYYKLDISYLFERDEYDWVFDPSIANELDKFFRDLGKLLLSFDWRHKIELDLLKKIYQNVVPREIRRQLGEFYTPDWIAQLMLWRALYMLVKNSPPPEYVIENPLKEIVELIDEFYRKHRRIPKFIDPTCGSYTFGVHYLNALLQWYTDKKPQLNSVDFVEQIVKSVIGIDLNPIAVITARVNYLLQIYRLLTIGGQYLVTQPIIPIFRIDLLSLHISKEDKQKTLYTFTVRSGDTSIYLKLPLEMLGINEKELSNLIKRLRENGLNILEKIIFEDHSRSKISILQLEIPKLFIQKAKDIQALAKSFIALLHPTLDSTVAELGTSLSKEEEEKLEKFRRLIQILETNGLDGLWHSLFLNYLLVQYGVKEKFDLILGNLPWVNISKYSKVYANLIKYIAEELGVLPPSQARKKLDISIPLFTISLKYLSGSPSIIALMVPCSIFKGLHGSAWRENINKPPYDIIEVWDLEDIQPFEGVNNQPGIIFIRKNDVIIQSQDKTFMYIKLSGSNLSPDRLSGREPLIKEVFDRINRKEISIILERKIAVRFTDGVHWISERTYNFSRSIIGTSPYEAHEGVTFTGAKGAWLVIGEPKPVQPPLGAPKTEKYVLVETQLSKQLGLDPFIIEEKFLFKGFKGEDIKIGKISGYRYFIAAYKRDGTALTEEELRKTLLWRNYIGKDEVINVLRRISTFSKKELWNLERMNKNAVEKIKVVWRDVADRFIPAVEVGGAIPDYTVNYITVKSPEEAYYLLAVLLAPQINEVIKELSPWIGHIQPRFIKYFKIPEYNPKNEIHIKLSKIGLQIAEKGDITDKEKEIIKELVDKI